MTVDGPTTEKGEQTRERIVSTAIRMFREKGYEKTTMRAVAAEAGVSLGNAYYYFAGKESLIQAYYATSLAEHRAAAQHTLDTEHRFPERLLGVLIAWFDSNRDTKDFAVSFFRTAADPSSPLSPFSEQSRETREESVAIFRSVVEGSDVRCAEALRPVLPELLWLYQMGLVLFWVHDPSPGAQRTYRLIRRSAPMVGRLVALSRLRVLRGSVDDLLGLLEEIGLRPAASAAPRS